MLALKIALAAAIIGSTGLGAATLGSLPRKHADTGDDTFRLCALLYLGIAKGR